MTIKVVCQCGQAFAAQPHLAGKTVACPKCRQPLTIPAESLPDDPLGLSGTDSGMWGQMPTAGNTAPPTSWVPPATNYPPGSFAPFAQQQSGSARPGRRSRGLSKGWIIALIVLAVIGIPTLLCCGGMAWFVRTPTGSTSAHLPFDLQSIPVPNLPPRGAPHTFAPGVDLYQVNIGNGTGFGGQPGHNMGIKVYLPKGSHSPRSLPCILITGAGTNLLFGVNYGDISLETEADEPEHIPYVRAGFAVVVYDIDGPVSDRDDLQDEEMKRAYLAFKASGAGVVNGRNAYEYVLRNVPEVNPSRVYSAGHSSAGTAALLLASHEPRLAGAIAYAPCTDVPGRFGGVALRGLSAMLPGLVDFSVQSSPRTHAARIRCPVFLFHAEDDSNVPIAESIGTIEQMKAAGVPVSFVKVSTGDHYDSMIQQGIPAAIQWLRTVDKP